jgi:hypothetical protein
MLMSDTPLFDALERLIAALPLDPFKVARALGTRLERHAEADTGAIEVHRQAADIQDGPWQSAELRMPDPDIGTGALLLNLALRPGSGLDQAAVTARFGLDFTTRVPSPRDAPGQVPVYLVYAKPWGQLSFGVSADDARILTRITVSASPLPAPSDGGS